MLSAEWSPGSLVGPGLAIVGASHRVVVAMSDREQEKSARPPPSDSGGDAPGDGVASAAVETSAVDTGCSVGIGCTAITILIILVGITIIVLTRW